MTDWHGFSRDDNRSVPEVVIALLNPKAFTKSIARLRSSRTTVA
jgi:hypothetical protein